MRRQKQQKSRKQQSANDLRHSGLRFFNRGNYDQAISQWERALSKQPLPDDAIRLSEAYFRRACQQPATALADLEKAHHYQPDSIRIQYHLGLVAHHHGDLETAVALYQAVRQSNNLYTQRTNYPLALALLQQGEAIVQTAVWPQLSPAEQALLQAAQTFQRRPYQVGDNAAPLWLGLAALDEGQLTEAQAYLTQSCNAADSAALSHNYLGVIAAAQENWPAATKHWMAAQTASFHSTILQHNLGELYHRLAEDKMGDMQVAAALAAATEAARFKTNDKSLNDLIAHAHAHLGHQAAAQNKWETAYDHWKTAIDSGGKTFRLVCNMALACEQLEIWEEAAELWRDAMRRRPRSSDHPDAVSDAEVSRLWQRTAEAYVKAGEYEEAVTVYKTAVKWQPDNLPLRIAYVDQLQDNGSFQAAVNELERILDQHKDYVPALIRMGEALSQSDYWYHSNGAPHYWKRALELEPDNALVKQHLADFYVERAEGWLQWNSYYEEAIESYQEALVYQPQNSNIMVEIGRCYLFMTQEQTAVDCFTQAVQTAPTHLDTHTQIIMCWLEVNAHDKAWAALQSAELLVPTIPYHFYIDLAMVPLYQQDEETAKVYLDRAIAKAPAGEPVLVAIGEMAAGVPEAHDVARTYLENGIRENQSPGQAHLMLGVIAAQTGDMSTAKKQWRKAATIARQTKDEALATRIEHAQTIFDNPMNALLQMLGTRLGMDPAELLDKMPFGFDDFDEEDDDFYF